MYHHLFSGLLEPMVNVSDSNTNQFRIPVMSYEWQPPQFDHQQPPQHIIQSGVRITFNITPQGQCESWFLTQAYNLLVQQSTRSDAPTAILSSHPQTPPNPSMVPRPAAYNPVRNAPIVKQTFEVNCVVICS
ncbi:hypothetical protein SLEP1_g4273 [Rubroshorea leprosula]|uniref:Uncharacterized protein n=1 Tax=Rubroshorea leprosula TaxID=152421 RepID=A0AAV5HYN2_9ROSI|nr:hypothetical protein SLEP1_g4273 [Rubroshorea leprosula]